jgi:anti-sigma factor RsiW
VHAVSLRAVQCADVEALLDLSVDGELLADDSAVLHGHVGACEACRARLEGKRRLKAMLAAAGRTVELPPSLEARVRADLRAHRRDRTARHAAGLIAAVAVAAALAAALVTARSAPPAAAPPAVAQAAFARHALDVPVDVATPDPRRVQEFLAARVGALKVPRLDALGYGLSGARVVDVGNSRGAQLVYAGGFGQRLSVVAVPDPDGGLGRTLGGAPVELEQGGLRVRTFSAAGNVVSVVGDLDHERLRRVSYEFER